MALPTSTGQRKFAYRFLEQEGSGARETKNRKLGRLLLSNASLPASENPLAEKMLDQLDTHQKLGRGS